MNSHGGVSRFLTADRTLMSALAHHAQARPNDAALVGMDGETVDNATLLTAVLTIQSQLRRLGLDGCCIAVLAPAGVRGATLILGVACAATLFPFNPALPASELAQDFRRAGVEAVITPDVRTHEYSWLADAGVSLVAASARGSSFVLEPIFSTQMAPRAGRGPVTGDFPAIILRSSGTTGSPKQIEVTHGNLFAMAEKLAEWFLLSHQDRVACTLPLFYAAGLKTTLFVPLILGASVGFPRPESSLNLADWLGSLQPTFLSVAPTPLRAMLDRVEEGRDLAGRERLRFAICGAAYLPPALRMEAEQVLRAPVLEYYGLSEAGAMAANPAPPGRRKPGTVGVFRPAELAVLDPEGAPVPVGDIGSVVISGPSVTPSREGADCVPQGPHAGWLITGDLGSVDEDGYLRLIGRTKEIINRGGEKVSPYEVEQVILGHPAVAEAAVFGVPHPRLGEGVAAAVVLKAGQSLTGDLLKSFLAERIVRFKSPQTIYFLDALPKGPTGKVRRQDLLEVGRAQTRPEAAEPDRMLEHQIFDIWRLLLETDSFGIDDDFFELGGDSLLAARMLAEVETVFGRQIPQGSLNPVLTIRLLTDALCADLGPSRELMTKVQNGPGTPLFFCHGDYTSRGLYANRLLAELGEDRPVYLLHSYQSWHRPDLTVEELASLYLPEILQACPSGPLLIGGYCNGALVAWALAALLERQGRRIKHVILIEAPSLNARPLFRAMQKLCSFGAALAPGRLGTWLEQRGMRAVWHHVRHSRLVARSRAPGRPLRQRATASKEPSPHWLYMRTLARFVPERLHADVTCVVADGGQSFDTEPSQWKRVSRSVQTIELPGTHHSIVTSKVTPLGVALRSTLSRADAPQHAGDGLKR